MFSTKINFHKLRTAYHLSQVSLSDSITPNCVKEWNYSYT